MAGRFFSRTLHRLNARWLAYEYRHATLAVLIIILFIIFFDSAVVSGLLSLVRQLGYLGVFIAGILSISFFTVAPAYVLIVELATELDPFGLAIVAGAGSMIGDWLLLVFFEERVVRELRPLLRKMGLSRVRSKLQHRFTSWLLFVAGAVTIATPLPDEIGIALLGISHFKRRYLLLVCFVLNTVGILALVLATRVIVK